MSFCKFFTLQNGEITPCAVGRACDADSIRAMDNVLRVRVI